MPIYAYRCSNCGHTQDALQRMSDPVLTVCPNCGQSTYVKQVTAAGFQLKGSGWYVTDFRGGDKGTGKPAAESGSAGQEGGDAKPGEPAKADSADAGKKADAPAAAPAPAAASPSPAAAPAPSTPSSSSGKTGS